MLEKYKWYIIIFPICNIHLSTKCSLFLFVVFTFHSLKHMEQEWKAYVDEYTSTEILLSNCIAAAAFLTYCGAMGVDRRFVNKNNSFDFFLLNICGDGYFVYIFICRKRMGKFFMRVCKGNGLKVQSQHLFDRLTLPEFLKGKVCFLIRHF